VAAVGEIARVLRTEGELCVAIVHPLASAIELDPPEPIVIRQSYFRERRYVNKVRIGTSEIRLDSWHRPVQTYMDALLQAGFVVSDFRELCPSHELVERHPEMRKWMTIPLYLHLRARLSEFR
jgi:hypothetical protein